MDNLFVYIDETLAEKTLEERKRMYETIKRVVDPLAQYVTISRNGKESKCMTTASFLFFSNHTGAIYADQGTRRMFVCSNTENVGDAAFFKGVHEWLYGTDWPQHVWNYLRGVSVDLAEMSAKPPRTQVHEQMQVVTDTRIEDVIDAAFDILKSWGNMIAPPYLWRVVSRHLDDCLPEDMPEKQFTRAVSAKTLSFGKMKDFTPVVTAKGVNQRVRAIDPEMLGNLRLANINKSKYKDFLAIVTEKRFADYIRETLNHSNAGPKPSS